jgi:hypothetical protein
MQIIHLNINATQLDKSKLIKQRDGLHLSCYIEIDQTGYGRIYETHTSSEKRKLIGAGQVVMNGADLFEP